MNERSTIDRPQHNPRFGWGFEPRTCTLCGENKGGSPFRLCKCQREEQGIMDGSQPHLDKDTNER